MKKPEGDKDRLFHILDSCDEIIRATKNHDINSFMQDHVLRIACVKWLEIIGEASKHITQDTKNLKPSVEWHKIVGMRNVIVHEYFGIDFPAVWNAILKEIEPLKESVEELINKYN